MQRVKKHSWETQQLGKPRCEAETIRVSEPFISLTEKATGAQVSHEDAPITYTLGPLSHKMGFIGRKRKYMQDPSCDSLWKHE